MKNNKLAPLSHDELRGLSGGITWWHVLVTICMMYDASTAASEGISEEAESIIKEKGW